MTGSREDTRLRWQSKAVLLLVLPWTVTSVAIESIFWAQHAPVVVWQALGISAVFGLLVWKMRAATVGGALTGAAITASLMLSTASYPYEWAWLHGGLMPLLAVFVLTYAATKIGRKKKEKLGTAESKRGRNAAQVAANLGVAAVACGWGGRTGSVVHLYPSLLLIAGWAVFAEAAADTVSSEIGQVLGGTPRMITTFRRVAPGTDGGITLAGSAAGLAAAIAIAAIGSALLTGNWTEVLLAAGAISVAGTAGLLFDSLLGATLERSRLLNNDAVNFLSTVFAAAVGAGLEALVLMRV